MGEEERLPHRLDGEIHLWFAFSGATEDPPGGGFSRGLGQVLDDEEKARMARLHDPAGRRLFEVSHTLVRSALSNYSGIPPEQWRFLKDAHGKPLIDPALDAPPLSFSLAHTRGAAIVAVAEGADVGADLEREDRAVDAARLSSRFFSTEEDAVLRAINPARLRERFFHFWTLKESYIKARGLGLLLPLDSFSFHLTAEIPRRIGFSGIDPDDTAKWRFALLTPLPPYAAAVGFATARPEPVRLRCFHFLPSGEVSPLGAVPLGLSPGVEIDPGPLSRSG